MTPQEISEARIKWMKEGGYSVSFHSDKESDAKEWCKNIPKQNWKLSRYTDVYEHTIFFKDLQPARLFESEFR